MNYAMTKSNNLPVVKTDRPTNAGLVFSIKTDRPTNAGLAFSIGPAVDLVKLQQHMRVLSLKDWSDPSFEQMS